MVASMEARPSLISVEKCRLNTSAQPFLPRPAGSQKPTEACAPGSPSKARSGGPAQLAPSTQADPAKPSSKNMLMMGTMARRPFAITESSFFVVSSRSKPERSGGFPPTSTGVGATQPMQLKPSPGDKTYQQ